ncbi:unnamed protein product [Camellia sinensis]
MCTMDSGLKLEQKSLINELTQGMEIAKQLRFHLNSASSAENRQLLLQRILSSYEKSLLILKSSAPTTGMPESSISGDGSPQSEDCNGGGGLRIITRTRMLSPRRERYCPHGLIK